MSEKQRKANGRNAASAVIMTAPYMAQGVVLSATTVGGPATAAGTGVVVGGAAISRAVMRHNNTSKKSAHRQLRTAATKAQRAHSGRNSGMRSLAGSSPRSAARRASGSPARSGGSAMGGSRNSRGSTAGRGGAFSAGSGGAKSTKSTGAKNGSSRPNSGGKSATGTLSRPSGAKPGGSGSGSGKSRAGTGRSGSHGFGGGSSKHGTSRGGKTLGDKPGSSRTGSTGSRSGKNTSGPGRGGTSLGNGRRATAARSARGGGLLGRIAGGGRRNHGTGQGSGSHGGRNTPTSKRYGSNGGKNHGRNPLSRGVRAVAGRVFGRRSPGDKVRKDREQGATNGEKTTSKHHNRSRKHQVKAQRAAARKAMRKRKAMTAHVLREIGSPNHRKHGRRIAGYAWAPMRKAREMEPGAKQTFAMAGATALGAIGTLTAMIPGSVWLFRGPRLAGVWLGREIHAARDGFRVLTNPYTPGKAPQVIHINTNGEPEGKATMADLESIETNLDTLIEAINNAPDLQDVQRDGVLPGSVAGAWAAKVTKVAEALHDKLENDAQFAAAKVDQNDDGHITRSLANLFLEVKDTAKELSENWIDAHGVELNRQLQGDERQAAWDTTAIQR